MRAASASNSAFSLARRASWAFLSFSIIALLAALTGMPRPRGSRKLRA